ncbi:MAG: hypothetical protein COB81_00320 [Flavobacteriaceae bacterium]|nr:MAG: hypothetical protein COB81_00320 [Flavobacteriaceae bacterium]
MKELNFTTEELEQVGRYLDMKGLVFVDIRFEILDHLLLDIEFEMNSKNLLFDIAFENVCQKWKESMKPTSSYWLGKGLTASRIVIDKNVHVLKKSYLKLFLMIVFSILIGLAVQDVLNSYFIDNRLIINKALAGFAGGSMFLGTYWIYKMNKGDVKTSFSFIFSKVFGTFVLLFVFMTSTDFFKESQGVSLLIIAVFSFGIQSFVFLVSLWYQHNKQVSMYKKQL